MSKVIDYTVRISIYFMFVICTSVIWSVGPSLRSKSKKNSDGSWISGLWEPNGQGGYWKSHIRPLQNSDLFCILFVHFYFFLCPWMAYVWEEVFWHRILVWIAKKGGLGCWQPYNFQPQIFYSLFAHPYFDCFLGSYKVICYLLLGNMKNEKDT